MRDHRGAGAGPVGKEDVDAAERLAHLGGPRPAGPEVLVVLAGDQRNARGRGARGRPPGAEHVGVNEVGGGEPRIKPRGEARLRNPLQVPALPPDLGLRATPAREFDAGRGRPAAVKDRGDPMAAQLAHHPQHRQLRAARLELGDHARDQHNPEPLAVRCRRVRTTIRRRKSRDHSRGCSGERPDKPLETTRTLHQPLQATNETRPGSPAPVVATLIHVS